MIMFSRDAGFGEKYVEYSSNQWCYHGNLTWIHMGGGYGGGVLLGGWLEYIPLMLVECRTIPELQLPETGRPSFE